MSTLGNASDIFSNALDNGISIMDALWELSESVDDGVLSRDQVFERLNLDNSDNINSIVFRSSRGKSSIGEKRLEWLPNLTNILDDFPENSRPTTDKVLFKLEIKKIATLSPVKILKRSRLSEVNHKSRKKQKLLRKTRNTPQYGRVSQTGHDLSGEDNDYSYDHFSQSLCKDEIKSEAKDARKQFSEKNIFVSFEDTFIRETYDYTPGLDMSETAESQKPFNNEEKARREHDGPDKLSFNDSMISQGGEVIGVPILKAFDDLCGVADALLTEYKSAKEGECDDFDHHQQDQLDGIHHSDTADDIILMSDDLVEDNLQDIGLQATEVLKSFKRMQESRCWNKDEITEDMSRNRKEHIDSVDTIPKYQGRYGGAKPTNGNYFVCMYQPHSSTSCSYDKESKYLRISSEQELHTSSSGRKPCEKIVSARTTHTAQITKSSSAKESESSNHARQQKEQADRNSGGYDKDRKYHIISSDLVLDDTSSSGRKRSEKNVSAAKVSRTVHSTQIIKSSSAKEGEIGNHARQQKEQPGGNSGVYDKDGQYYAISSELEFNDDMSSSWGKPCQKNVNAPKMSRDAHTTQIIKSSSTKEIESSDLAHQLKEQAGRINSIDKGDGTILMSDDFVEDNLQESGLQATEVFKSIKRMQEKRCSKEDKLEDV